MKRLANQAKAARDTYVAAAEAQSAARRKGAGRLDKAVAAELGPLKLEKAKFVTDLAAMPETEWSEHGTDRVQFTVATNPGTPPAPIARIASGGELSRFLLALKVCLAKVGDAATIVFDEVDSGIGGATAAAVGERLKRLAKDVQVLVVTHSPQVAASPTALADPQDHDQECSQHRRAGARCQGPPRGDRPHAVGCAGDRRSARRGRPAAGGGS